MGYPLGRLGWVLKCFGHILSITRAHLGQRACPCWVTCLPHMGTLLAHFVTFLLSLPMIVIWVIKGLARDVEVNEDAVWPSLLCSCFHVL